MQTYSRLSTTSAALRARAAAVIPGGCHTYAKGDDQFPESAPPFIVRGRGSHVWDVEGREYIEYGMGLRAVTLGHAFAPVVEAVAQELGQGVNFTRPSPLEVECADELLALVPGMEMVKFCKDGSLAVDGAVRLARATTGREMIAICGDHPFFSTNDWFIGTTQMNAGIPESTRRNTVKFSYNDVSSLESVFDQYPGQVACVIMEPARTEEPAPGYLSRLKALCHERGALLIFDEMITGFRWHLHGAQHLYGVTPDLCTFGKALANGFSVSALLGSRDVMSLGGSAGSRERVFLLSTTHGAETHTLAAAIAVMRFYSANPVIETLHDRGHQLRLGCEAIIRAHGLENHLNLMSRDCNLLFGTRDGAGQPSQPFRTLFMQEMVRGGVLAPSFVVSYSHTEADIDRTLEAFDAALRVYRLALEHGVEKYLIGPSVKPVFRRHV